MENTQEATTELTKKRTKKTKYFVTTSPQEFDSKRDVEAFLSENRPNENTRVIKGATVQSNVKEHVILT